MQRQQLLYVLAFMGFSEPAYASGNPAVVVAISFAALIHFVFIFWLLWRYRAQKIAEVVLFVVLALYAWRYVLGSIDLSLAAGFFIMILPILVVVTWVKLKNSYF
jgi:hypothetical protein